MSHSQHNFSWFAFAKRFEFKKKLALMLFFPVVGMLFFAVSGALEKNHIVNQSDATLKFVKFSVLASALVHEIQIERGMTVGFLSSRGAKFETQLLAHRNLATDQTDKVLRSFLSNFDPNIYGNKFRAYLTKSLQKLDSLKGFRQQVDKQLLTSSDAIRYFSNMNAIFLDAIGQIHEMATNIKISNSSDAYINFLKGKERAGIERAILTHTFSINSFEPGKYRKFGSLVAKQSVFFNTFRSLASTEQVVFFDKKMQRKEVTEVERMRQIAFNWDKHVQDPFKIDPKHWFSNITIKIGLLKEVEDILSEGIASKAHSLSKHASRIFTVYVLLILFNILSAIFLIYVVGRGLNLHLSHDRQTTLFQLMNLGLEPQPLNIILSRSLDLIHSIPWISLKQRGEIFLNDEKTGKFVPPSQLELPKSGEALSSAHLEHWCECQHLNTKQNNAATFLKKNNNKTCFECLPTHGYICIPLSLGDKIVGLIKIYIDTHYTHAPEDDLFLSSSGHILATIIERKRAETQNNLLLEKQKVLISLLELAIKPTPLNQLLETALQTIFSIPWLAILSKGSIFLADTKKGCLSMIAQRGLAPELLSKCATVPFGYCLCGQAASTQKIIFKNTVDDDHDVRFDAMQPHGHYCIPIHFEKKLLGVLNLYISEHHIKQDTEEDFLQAIASTLALIINQKQEKELLLKLSRAVEQSPATVIISDLNGVIEYVNPKFTDVTGYSAQEAIGKTPAFLKSGDKSPEDYQDLWLTISAGQEWRGEFKNQKKGGEEFWEFASISPIRSKTGELTNFIAIKEDITERKKIDQKIKDALEFQTITSHLLRSGIHPLTLKELLDYTLDLVLSVSNFAVGTKGVVSMYDQGLDKMVLTCHKNLPEQIVENYDQITLEQGICQLALTNHKLFFSEYVSGGETLGFFDNRAFSHYCLPIVFDEQMLGMINIYLPANHKSNPDEEKFLTTVAHTVASIIKRKEVEEELYQHRDHLDQLVKIRTVDLEKANQTKSEFLANMSHELRTPLHAVLSFTEMGGRRINKLVKQLSTTPETTNLTTLQESLELGKNLDKVVHYYNRIGNNGKQLRGLIDNLLDLAKLESGKMDFDFQQHDLLTIIGIEEDRIETLLLDKNLSLQINSPQNGVAVYCDNTKIGQVILNLFSNAIKFSPAGKTITVAFSEAPLNNTPMTVFSVSDEGTGIPPEELDLVFDKFAQSSRTKNQAGGTGLGLAICLEIVTTHNGTIRAANRPGGGSIFTVMLPKQEFNHG
jgi:PAS domain S-box-containing protein